MLPSSTQRTQPDTGSPSSYSRKKHNNLSVGVDTITLCGDIRDYDRRVSTVEEHVDGDGVITRVDKGRSIPLRSGFSAAVHFRAGQNRARVRAEVSAPRFARGSNVFPSPVAEVREVAEVLYDELAEHVEWSTRRDELWFNRLDVATDVYLNPDLGVSVALLLDGLAGQPGQRAGRAARYRDPCRGHAETLVRGVKGRWQASLYAKHADALYQAERPSRRRESTFLRTQAESVRDVVRAEVSLRAGVLNDLELRRLTSLTDDGLRAAAATYCRRAGFEEIVMAGPDLTTAVKRLISEGGAGLGALGALAAESLGCDLELSAPTRRKYRALLQQHGLSGVNLTQLGSAHSAVRIDFDDARVVALA